MNIEELKILKKLVSEGYKLKQQHNNPEWKQALEEAEDLIKEQKLLPVKSAEDDVPLKFQISARWHKRLMELRPNLDDRKRAEFEAMVMEFCWEEIEQFRNQSPVDKGVREKSYDEVKSIAEDQIGTDRGTVRGSREFDLNGDTKVGFIKGYLYCQKQYTKQSPNKVVAVSDSEIERMALEKYPKESLDIYAPDQDDNYYERLIYNEGIRKGLSLCKGEAVEFAEWLGDQWFDWDRLKQMYYRENKEYPTQELYSLFKSTPKQ